MRFRSLLMLGLALVLGGLAVFLAQDWMQRQVPKAPVIVKQEAPEFETTKVVVAATPLFFGNKIRRESLRLVDWPVTSVPPGSFKSFDELLGNDEERVSLRAIEVGEPVLQSKVSGFGGRAILSAVIAPEMRAVTIRVNDVNGVAGFVLPGDHVDVLLTRNLSGGGGKGNLITDVLLQNIKVLGIDQQASEQLDKPKVAKAVTMEVTQLQAQKLALAQKVGTLSLALRHLLNVDAEAVRRVTLADLNVGEANQAADAQKVAEGEKKPTKKTVVVKRATSGAKRSDQSKVRIVRALKAQTYKVAPERSIASEPAFSKPLNLLPGQAVTPRAETPSAVSGSQDKTEEGEGATGAPTNISAPST